ncbi:TetR/AcrR family transcriptional regulator [Dactylosporangium sp. CA-092794]|uniref:TetR/AcrR family transcriptional regulator n=1 Tax=Dactylosporangium sp. CA-092794 TaxID=3239929 RepID=UPI003D94284E
MTRPLRADAVRNRSRIVRAARKLIAGVGAEVGMDEIAHEAGVAVGTVYRHFPAKADLIAAIVQDRVEEISSILEGGRAAIAAGGSARDELVAVVTAVAERVGEDRALKAAAGGIVAGSLSDVEHRALTVLADIVAAGHREGSLRPDVTVDDVALILTLLPGDDIAEPGRRRWLVLTLRGILREDDRPG